MAIIQVFTQTGLDLKAEAFSDGSELTVDNIRAITSSSGFVTTEAAAIALTAMPGDSAGTRVDNNNPFGRHSGNVAQFGFVGTGTAVYLIYSYGFYNANRLIGYVCDSDGASIGGKSAATAALTSLTVEFTNGDTTGLAENNYVLIPPGSEDFIGGLQLATQAEFNAGTDDKKAVTSKKFRTWWNALSIPASKISGLSAQLANYVTLNYLAGVLRGKADVHSDTLTGEPKSTTPAATDSSTRIATTAFVNSWYADTIHVSTSDPTSSDGSRGDIWLKREA